MKKKVLALGLAMTMLFSLAACGNTASTATESTTAAATTEAVESTVAETEAVVDDTQLNASITLWTYPVGKWGDAATVEGLIASFNEKYPNIQVAVELLDYTNGDDQINTAIEGGQAPDLVLEGPERLVANWGAKGYMVDLSDLFAQDSAKDIYENVVAACQGADGSYYEYPLCMIAHCMAINRDIFEKADALQYLDESTNTWKSTDDFLKAIQAVYDSGHKNVLSVYCGGQGGDQGTRAMINNMYSGRFTNLEHTAYAVNSPENIKALEALKAQQGVNFDASIVGGDEITLFRNETLAVAMCWNAMQQNNTDNAPAGETNNGSTILPMLFPTDDGKVELAGGIWGFGVFDNGDENKIAAAKAFINFMANDPEQVKQSVQSSGFFSVHKSVTGVYADTEKADTMEMFTKNFMPSLGDYYQVVPGWAQARTAWWNMLQRIGTGGAVADEVAAFETEANAAAAEAMAQ